MIFHASIEADDPSRVAAALARLWQAESFPFPPVAEGSHIVLSGDAHNSALEIYPRGTALFPTEGDPEARPVLNPPRHGPVHLAVATALEPQAVFALAADNAWLAQPRNRGGLFDLIELWVEDSLLIEVLTPEMQRQYLAAMTPDGWRAALAAA